jgi:starch phosphorylase
MFNATRMVMDYAERFYLPAARRAIRLGEDNLARARSLAEWKRRISREWHRVGIASAQAQADGQLRVGQTLDVVAEVSLGDLTPGDVSVQCYTGSLDTIGRLRQTDAIPMTPDGEAKDGKVRFVGQIPCQASGRRGFAIRVVPNNEDLANVHELSLVRWAE